MSDIVVQRDQASGTWQPVDLTHVVSGVGGGVDQSARDQLAAILAGSTPDEDTFAEIAALLGNFLLRSDYYDAGLVA